MCRPLSIEANMNVRAIIYRGEYECAGHYLSRRILMCGPLSIEANMNVRAVSYRGESKDFCFIHRILFYCPRVTTLTRNQLRARRTNSTVCEQYTNVSLPNHHLNKKLSSTGRRAYCETWCCDDGDAS